MSSNNTRVCIHGLSGRMGQEIKKLLTEQSPEGVELIGGSTSQTSEKDLVTLLNSSDVIIDFSTVTASIKLFDLIKKNGIKNRKVLLCTTGLSEKELTTIRSITNYKSYKDYKIYRIT